MRDHLDGFVGWASCPSLIFHILPVPYISHLARPLYFTRQARCLPHSYSSLNSAMPNLHRVGVTPTLQTKMLTLPFGKAARRLGCAICDSLTIPPRPFRVSQCPRLTFAYCTRILGKVALEGRGN